MQLVIGNKNYSSWSLRPWLLLRHFQLDFEEIRVPLFVPGYQDELGRYSASQKVPVLLDDGITVWDSLAICEYISEKYTAGKALPEDQAERAICRSYCSEMHSGFMAIRSQLPMNCRATRKLEFAEEVLAECARIDSLWRGARDKFRAGGDYLFGAFSLADCMYAPMVMRFHSYGVNLSEISQAYVNTLLKNAAVKQWREAAAAESELLPDYEIGQELSP